MEITFLGNSSFKIKTKLGTLLVESGSCSIEADKTQEVKRTITGPGEYEVSGISVMAYRYNRTPEIKSTIYVYEAEGLRLAYLGDVESAITEDLVDKIGDVEVLMIGSISKEASGVVSKIEPSFVVVPSADSLKDAGFPSETLPKFSIKKDDILEDQNIKVIVLEKK